MTEDQDPVPHARSRARSKGYQRVKTTGALGRIALCALAQSSPKLRDLIEAALDVEVLDRRTARQPGRPGVRRVAAEDPRHGEARVALTTDGETLERVLIAAARRI